MKTLSYLFMGLFICLTVQANQQAAVEQTAQKYFQAVKAYDTNAMSKMLHPEALAQFRSSLDSAFAGSKKEQAKKELLPLFSVSTLDQFNALSDQQAYLRFSNFVVNSQPQLKTLMQSANINVIGAMVEGDVAVVNYTLSMTIQGQSINQDTLQKFKLHDGKWLALLPPNGEASIAGIRNRYN